MEYGYVEVFRTLILLESVEKDSTHQSQGRIVYLWGPGTSGIRKALAQKKESKVERHHTSSRNWRCVLENLTPNNLCVRGALVPRRLHAQPLTSPPSPATFPVCNPLICRYSGMLEFGSRHG
ncbi:hypothetical protein CBL_10029 [Carabus blaptoides fortunei]